jgi:hypothetical protein
MLILYTSSTLRCVKRVRLVLAACAACSSSRAEAIVVTLMVIALAEAVRSKHSTLAEVTVVPPHRRVVVTLQRVS